MGKQRPTREGGFSGGERVGAGSQRAPTPQYEPIVTEGNEALVHHMEVFQCAAEFETIPHFSGPCDSKMKPQRLNFCRHVLAAWALGAKVRAPPASPRGAPSPHCLYAAGVPWLFGATDASSSPCSFPHGHHSRSPSSSAGFGGDCAQGGPGATLAASRVFQQLPPAAQRWAWAVGSPGVKSSLHPLTSSLTGALCGLVMSCPSAGERHSNLAAPPTLAPTLSAQAPACGWICPDPPRASPGACPVCLLG